MMRAVEAETPFSETEPLWCEKDSKGDPVIDPNTKKPKEKAVDKTTIEWYRFDIEYKAWKDKKDKCDENKVTTSSVILGQCTKAVRTKLEAKVDWATIRFEPIELMKSIRAITQDSEDEKYHPQSVLMLMKKVVNVQQQEHESLSSYAQRFKTLVDLFETKFGKLNMDKCCENDPK